MKTNDDEIDVSNISYLLYIHIILLIVIIAYHSISFYIIIIIHTYYSI